MKQQMSSNYENERIFIRAAFSDPTEFVVILVHNQIQVFNWAKIDQEAPDRAFNKGFLTIGPRPLSAE